MTNCEMGKHAERVLKKNLLKLYTTSHNNTNWYTDTDGFLEYSLSRGSLCYKGPVLQKIILGVFWVPLVHIPDSSKGTQNHYS